MKPLQTLTIILLATFAIAGTIDLDNLFNYAMQPVPNYITKDNTPPNNLLTDEGATLGRVLFYDKALSVNNTIACGSCHLQEFAFGDTAQASLGVNGRTGRHSMRLINARFSNERRAFWDERAASFEEQATLPIQDHVEMGFSGTMGDPDLDSLIRRMQGIDYYNRLFSLVYGDSVVTEARMQQALAQFVRSIQSYDSKYDVGRAQAPNDGAPFPNFTMQENMGKALFLGAPNFDMNGVRINGGAGCAGCHRPPEFDIDDNSRNNGVIAAIGGGTDLTNTRSPSLRDVVDANGNANGPMMHNGRFPNLMAVINHYDSIRFNPDLDPLLMPSGTQVLNLTAPEKLQLVAFLQTLTGTNVYTDERWSDPFDGDSLTLLPLLPPTSIAEAEMAISLTIYPNPTTDFLNIQWEESFDSPEMRVVSLSGQVMYQGSVLERLDVSAYPSGYYVLTVGRTVKKFVKR